MHMLSRIAIFALFTCSNLLLYYILLALQYDDELNLLFRGVRVVFLTSMIMQVLFVIGIVKIRQLK